MERPEHSWLDGLFVFGPVVLLLVVAIWRDWLVVGSFEDEDEPVIGSNWVATGEGGYLNVITGERL